MRPIAAAPREIRAAIVRERRRVAASSCVESVETGFFPPFFLKSARNSRKIPVGFAKQGRRMARKPTQSATEAHPTHQSIAADIAAFRTRGGRIEVLGNTPLRAHPSSPFRSSPEQRKPPTPIKRNASR
jgi:hypothetical protein